MYLALMLFCSSWLFTLIWFSFFKEDNEDKDKEEPDENRRSGGGRCCQGPGPAGALGITSAHPGLHWAPRAAATEQPWQIRSLWDGELSFFSTQFWFGVEFDFALSPPFIFKLVACLWSSFRPQPSCFLIDTFAFWSLLSPDPLVPLQPARTWVWRRSLRPKIPSALLLGFQKKAGEEGGLFWGHHWLNYYLSWLTNFCLRQVPHWTYSNHGPATSLWIFKTMVPGWLSR